MFAKLKSQDSNLELISMVRSVRRVLFLHYVDVFLIMFGCCNVNCNDKSTCFAEDCLDEFGFFRMGVLVMMFSHCFNVVMLFY